MIQYVLNHPWLLTLLGVPALIAAAPKLLRKLEGMAFQRIMGAVGSDPADQKAVRGTIAVWTTWAEEKYAAGSGPVKFAAVDALLSKALPFLSADDRKRLIEESVAQLDAGAHEVSDATPQAPTTLP